MKSLYNLNLEEEISSLELRFKIQQEQNNDLRYKTASHLHGLYAKKYNQDGDKKKELIAYLEALKNIEQYIIIVANNSKNEHAVIDNKKWAETYLKKILYIEIEKKYNKVRFLDGAYAEIVSAYSHKFNTFSVKEILKNIQFSFLNYIENNFKIIEIEENNFFLNTFNNFKEVGEDAWNNCKLSVYLLLAKFYKNDAYKNPNHAKITQQYRERVANLFLNINRKDLALQELCEIALLKIYQSTNTEEFNNNYLEMINCFDDLYNYSIGYSTRNENFSFINAKLFYSNIIDNENYDKKAQIFDIIYRSYIKTGVNNVSRKNALLANRDLYILIDIIMKSNEKTDVIKYINKYDFSYLYDNEQLDSSAEELKSILGYIYCTDIMETNNQLLNSLNLLENSKITSPQTSFEIFKNIIKHQKSINYVPLEFESNQEFEDDIIDLSNILKNLESVNLEVKMGFLNDSIGETISSFANTNGGDILIGIGETKELEKYIAKNYSPIILNENFFLCGTQKDIDGALLRFMQNMRSNLLHFDHSLLNHEIINIKGKTVVKFTIPPVAKTSGVLVLYKNIAYKRNGSSDYKMSMSEAMSLQKKYLLSK